MSEFDDARGCAELERSCGRVLTEMKPRMMMVMSSDVLHAWFLGVIGPLAAC